MRWSAAVGLGLLAAGCASLALSFTGLPWYRAGNGPYAPPYGGPAPRTFGDLRVHFAIPGTGHEGAIYFGWLWWTFGVALVVIGLYGGFGGRWRGARWISIGLGAFSALVTYTAFSGIVELDASVAQRADIGLWVAILGYLLAALGASIAQPASSRSRMAAAERRGPAQATT